MLEQLKKDVWKANLDLVKERLVVHTWGNVSGIDRERGLVVIKASGVAYDQMKPAHMVVVSLESGKVAEGKLNPSSDTPTHLALYRGFPQIGGVVHTHSLYATAWAQAKKDLPCYGTTHADYWHGDVPCTRFLERKKIEADYEANTGKLILERFQTLDPLHVPAVLVAGHGPFTWGENPDAAVHHAVVLEFVARLASETLRLDPKLKQITPALLNKHFLRKHGPKAYYGQK